MRLPEMTFGRCSNRKARDDLPRSHHGRSIPSGYDPTPNSPNSGDEYDPGGGAHNFPRMLEKWTGVNMNFKGSMVQLFNSKMFTGQWQTGDLYYPPVRNWSANESFVRRPSLGLFAFAMYSRGP